MPKIYFLTLILLLSAACSDREGKASFTPVTPPAKADSSLTFLRVHDGQYPSDVRLLEIPVLKTRIISLAGADVYNFIGASWHTQTPIDVQGDTLSVWGMQDDSGGDPGAAIGIDLDRDVLYLALKNKGEVTYHSEDQSNPPLILKTLIGDSPDE